MTEDKLTYEELDAYIEETCRDSDGVIQYRKMSDTVQMLGTHLTGEQRWALYCRMVVDPSKLREKLRREAQTKYRED